MEPIRLCSMNPLKYVDRTGKDLVVAVGGVEYKVVRIDGTYQLQGNNGSNKLVQASQALVNTIASKFGTEVADLVQGKQVSLINITNLEEGVRNGTHATYNNDNSVATTRSDVGITAADDPESIVAFGTEIVVANKLVTGKDPFQQTSQRPTDGTMIIEDTENGPQRMAAFERTRANLEYEVRAKFGINPGEYLRLNRFDIGPLLVDGSGPPNTLPNNPNGTGSYVPPPPEEPLDIPPPPPLPRRRPIP